MYLAKFKSNGETIGAGSYRPFVHSPDLECGDPDCHAPVVFRKGSGDGGVIDTHGQSFTRSKHFATLPKRAHREGCSNHELHDDPEERKVSFRAAINDPQMKLVINLNGETGSGLKVRFANATQVEHSQTQFGQFMRDNRGAYASIGVRSLHDFMAQVQQIRELGGRDALARTQVCHHLSLRSLQDVLVGQNPDRLKALYRQTFDGADSLATLPDRIVGFPRVFHFVPTNATRKSDQPAKYLGNSIDVATSKNGACRMVLLSGLNPGADSIKTRLNTEKELLILACPVVHPVDARQESLLYKRGEKPDGHKGAVKKVDGGAWFLYMDWVITSVDQVASVPEEKRQLKTAPQKRLRFE